MRFTCLECANSAFALCSAQLDAQTGHSKLLMGSVWSQFLHSIFHGLRVGRVIRFTFVGWLVGALTGDAIYLRGVPGFSVCGCLWMLWGQLHLCTSAAPE